MPAHLEAQLRHAAKSGWERSRRAARRVFPIWILAVCVLTGMPSGAIHAEENSAVFPSITTVSLNIALVHSFSVIRNEQTMRLDFDSRFSSTLKELAAEKEAKNAVSKSLLRKRLNWPGEGPRAKVRPGFGELFHGETVEPLRCSGVGVEDSRYLYVKFSFRF